MDVLRKRIVIAFAVASVAAFMGIAVAKSGSDASGPSSIHARAFGWLRPSSVPTDWSAWRLPGSPARLPAPPGWRHEAGDPGTRTVVLKGSSDAVAGYLNATPREGTETPANWSRFRVAHNREEGDREVRLLAAAAGLRFRAATGSCVLDSYRTSSDRRYRELACIVAGRSGSTVIVAAAPPARWRAEAPTLERAIASFTT